MCNNIVRPDLPPLNPALRRRLIERVNTIELDYIIHYLQTKEISEAELSQMSEERKQLVEQRFIDLRNVPDPQEQADWTDIQNLITSNGPQNILKRKLEKYIQEYRDSRPSGNHVDEAQGKLNEIASSEIADLEKADWGKIPAELPKSLAEIKIYIGKLNEYLRKYEMYGENSFNVSKALDHKQKAIAAIENIEYDLIDWFRYSSVLKYLREHPNTTHFEELDDALWGLTNNPISLENLERFIEDINSIEGIPQSKHLSQANAALRAYSSWQPIADRRDIIEVKDFIDRNDDSPLLDAANILLRELKKEEFALIEHNPSAYSAARCTSLINAGIFTIKELENKGLITQDSFRRLAGVERFKTQNPVDPNRYKNPDEKEDDDVETTDVFFFGIPSTGKTCILMGLLSSNSFVWNQQIAGGLYGDLLKTYCDEGMLPERTQGSFVAKIHGKIYDDDKNVHHINLIEMSGEEFAVQISRNEKHITSFDEMGTNATQILKNNHKKIFFFIIDPTTELCVFNREVETHDEDGNIDTETQTIRVRQSSILKGMMDLLDLDSNKEIMDNVDALHFIATKADTLYSEGSPDEVARELIVSRYGQLLRPALELCSPSKYEINPATNFKPRLYTFSLGKFYAGGVYDYDSTDSEKILSVIRKNTRSVKPHSFNEKIKAFFNKEIL